MAHDGSLGGKLGIIVGKTKMVDFQWQFGQPGRVFTREQLLEQAWEDPGSAMDRTIDTHIKSLRAKLRQHSDDAAETIQTRRGLGYTLVL